MSNYLVEQQTTGMTYQQTAMPQQVQSMHISFDTTGYPIAPMPHSQPVVVSETSKKNSMWVAGGLVVALAAGSGAIGHHFGASGEAQKAQQQKQELTEMRSGVAALCKIYNK